jgi:hypothetical protein
MGNIVSDPIVQPSNDPQQVGSPATPVVSAATPISPETAIEQAVNPPAVEPPPLSQPQPSPDLAALNPGVIEGIGESKPAGFGKDPFAATTEPPAPESVAAPALATTEGAPPSITPEPPPPPPEEPPITPPAPEETPTESPTSVDAAKLLSQMPDVKQMMKDLEKSGCLLPELHTQENGHGPTDHSPLAALQPQRIKDNGFFTDTDTEPAKPLLPEVQLATTSQIVAKKGGGGMEIPLFLFVGLLSWLQAAQGIAQLVHFSLLTYPTYEQRVIAGEFTTAGMNAAVMKGGILATFTSIAFFAGGTVLIKRTKNNSAFLYFTLATIILNFFIQNVLVTKEFVSGNPLALPTILSEIFANR